MDVKIRKELQTDKSAISSVTEAAFKEASHSSHTEHFIVNALRKNNVLTISLVAEASGAIIGHVAISPVSISDGAKKWFGLGPISVLPKHQRQGIGSQLMKQVLSELKDLGASGCVVLGDPNYYGRFGFKVDPNLVFPGVPSEYFQALSYTSEIPQGEVAYHEAFNAQG